MNKVRVMFEYDEVAKKWEVVVTGVQSDDEAREAFNSVLITCDYTTARTDHLVVKAGEDFRLTPVLHVPN